jgi:hypothetical protein
MPTLPDAPNILALSLGFTVGADGTVHSRTFWKYAGGPPSATDLTTMATAALGHAAGGFAPLMAGSVAVDSAMLQDLASHSGASGIDSAQTTGGRGGSELPAGVCCDVQYIIGRRYRGGKPRSYYPFGVEGDLATASRWAPAFTAAVTAAVDTFKTDMLTVAAGGTTITDHMSLSYYSGFTVVTNPVTGRARNVPTKRAAPLQDRVVSNFVSLVPGSQRRRYLR